MASLSKSQPDSVITSTRILSHLEIDSCYYLSLSHQHRSIPDSSLHIVPVHDLIATFGSEPHFLAHRSRTCEVQMFSAIFYQYSFDLTLPLSQTPTYSQVFKTFATILTSVRTTSNWLKSQPGQNYSYIF